MFDEQGYLGFLEHGVNLRSGDAEGHFHGGIAAGTREGREIFYGSAASLEFAEFGEIQFAGVDGGGTIDFPLAGGKQSSGNADIDVADGDIAGEGKAIAGTRRKLPIASWEQGMEDGAEVVHGGEGWGSAP